ncbi:ASKHA domain-containing protein [Halodesulfovibrio marinisediminis]|uniref:Uncharacterized 2Fe-2 and 4Fe-4S clusters-containing protein, contains DUF4445 domain n=1 Tax=Halodesulfovibrio marinisediminis DSM 17456 TaxID=1121457 RepID=A0A1N6G0A2_9BACT|nr:ASKHA domain-containing protein [Halodesulfovibrio marinisediminis]SIO00985.1 Uncharacterized 2Fe-2 and 4Fe-4S clusters-containing protein, contains DUF4445 domain [Halodesulfovibrio marinisediminis DSM 17456]
MQITIIDYTGRKKSLHVPQAEPRTLAQVIFTSGLVPAPPLCSGLGQCGKCRVRFVENAPLPVGPDTLIFKEHAIDAGWRLACRHEPEDGMVIEIPKNSYIRHVEIAESSSKSLHLAIDLGTTSMHWTLLDGKKRIAFGSEPNPQMGAGSEIMSRLSFATTDSGKEILQDLVVSRITELIGELTEDSFGSVDSLAIAANPAMTYLLLGLDTSGLATAPYKLTYKGGTVETIADLPPAYIAPLAAPFVGGDLTAGLTSILQKKPEYPFVLTDMGTNGEFILALSPDNYLVTSVALGPALEGVGLHYGATAAKGIATSYKLTPNGLVPSVLDGKYSDGISGTGYLALIHALRKINFISNDGLFIEKQTQGLGARLAERLEIRHGIQHLALPDSMYLSAEDIEEFLKVKAAFTFALTRILETAEISAAQLKKIYLAGALGEHAAVQDLEGLGFIPAGMGSRVEAVNNTSLKGAELMLIDPTLRSMAESLTANCEAVDLTADPDFTQTFMRHMRFTFI